MPLHRSLIQLSAPSAVAIGNFDGCHLGHRAILQRLLDHASRLELQPVVLTFTPHPRLHLGHSIQLIQTDAQRLALLQAQPLAHLFFLDFAAVVHCPPTEFLQDVLQERLSMRMLVVGDDFRFGRGRQGDTAALTAAAARMGFSLDVVPPVVIAGRRVSSSSIRKLLLEGRVDAAAPLLGRNYAIDGVVTPGLRRGRTLGFPTLNLRSDNTLLPAGVFHTILEWRGASYPSVTNIGTNPTFAGSECKVETHVIDFQRDLYGEAVTLHFVRKLRDEIRFPAAAALVEQMERDVAEVRRATDSSAGRE